MMDNREFFVLLQRQIAKLIEGLTPEQVEQLGAGKAKLAFLPPGAQVAMPQSDVTERLAAMQNRKEATDYLGKFRVDELKALARSLDIAFTSSDKKAVLVQKIVDGTVGLREDNAAIRSWRK